MRLLVTKMLYSIILLLFFLFLLNPAFIHAQTGKTNFTGVVSDSKGNPLSGVTVTIKGATQKTLTNATGSFSIAANENDVLLLSSVGFSDQQVTLRRGETIAVNMLQDIGVLNDVVVVAYGTQRRKDITGSVAVVNVAETKKYSTNDVAQLLQGRAAGVQVNSDGQPGATPSVRIRGIGTFGNAQPLYVIDGVQVGTVVRDFSPNDIESIQVLKDASAAALYGSAAANGVIIITTKQGRKNTPLRVEYNGYYGVDNV